MGIHLMQDALSGLSTTPADDGPAVDAAAFRAAMRNLAGGVAIVATGRGGERRGLTVSAVTSVSAEPPCLLICVNQSSSAHDALLANGAFSVNLLAADQSDVALCFAGQAGLSGADRFGAHAWHDGENGLPLLAEALCAMECRTMSSLVIGSHRLFVGRIVHAATRSGEPLVNFQGKLQTLEAA